MFQSNNRWSLWILFCRELNDHIEVEINKIVLFGAKKSRKTLAGHSLGKNLFKDGDLGDILSGYNNFIIEDRCSIYKRGKISQIDDSYIIDLCLHILRLTTNVRGSFAEDMFNYSPDIILRDDVLEGFLVKGCSRTKYCVGSGIGNFRVHDDVDFTAFAV